MFVFCEQIFTAYVALGTFPRPIYLPVTAVNSHNFPNHDNSAVVHMLLIAQPTSLLSEAKYLPYVEAEAIGGRMASRMNAKSVGCCRRRLILMMECVVRDTHFRFTGLASDRPTLFSKIQRLALIDVLLTAQCISLRAQSKQ